MSFINQHDINVISHDIFNSPEDKKIKRSVFVFTDAKVKVSQNKTQTLTRQSFKHFTDSQNQKDKHNCVCDWRDYDFLQNFRMQTSKARQ